MDIFQNIYFWIFVVSLIGGFFSIRRGHWNRDRAAFADFPDTPEKYLLRSRLYYGLSILFFLAVLTGIIVISFQFLQVVRPQLSLELSQFTSRATNTPVPTATALGQVAENVEPTATKVAEQISPTSAPTEVSGETAIASIGNTNFRGVNVRQDPGLDSVIIAKLVNQTEVFVLDNPVFVGDEYTWRRVRMENGMMGWIAEPFLIFMIDSGP